MKPALRLFLCIPVVLRVGLPVSHAGAAEASFSHTSPATSRPLDSLELQPAPPRPAETRPRTASDVRFAELERTRRTIAGWTLQISADLLATNGAATTRALELLTDQLEGIVRVVTKAAVLELQKVPLWISPEYPGTRPCAEYHPNVQWLREHGRDPAMAKGVEFTNIRIFEAETRRMPVFVLHELAHAYHDRVLGFGDARIIAAFEKAKAGGSYDSVQRRDAQGHVKTDRAYALTNAKEYFAETSEACFGTNDFFPFTRAELKRHDPEMFRLLAELWGEAKSGETTP